MQLGWIEKILFQNPLRAAIQRAFEARQILRLGGTCPNAKALEIGCGGGGGINLLFDIFGIRSLDAFDLDFEMISIANREYRAQSDRVNLWVGNARHIPVASAVYDAVFDFGALHHVHDWQSAVYEISRVIKPGGRFYIEEITRQFIVHPIWRRILDHPQANRFDMQDLNAVLEMAGFEVKKSRQFAGLFIWCIADRQAS